MPFNQRNESLMVNFQTQTCVGVFWGMSRLSDYSLLAANASAGICPFFHQWSCVCRAETEVCVIQVSVFTFSLMIILVVPRDMPSFQKQTLSPGFRCK